VPSAITDSSRSSPIGYGLAMSNAGKNLANVLKLFYIF
jgi:hypothetical protein